MTIPFFIVDAFSERPFRGNPAAVCVLSRQTTAEWMQAVAAEFNLPMTAFVLPHSTGGYELRWFTPVVEVELCGHATLATVHVLGGTREFSTKSGTLRCRLRGDGVVEMWFPAIPIHPISDSSAVERAAGLPSGSAIGVWGGDIWWLVEVPAMKDVRQARPDMELLRAFGGVLIVVAAVGGRGGVDTVCRVFEPASGLEEDAVTGSAHCVIAPWLAARTGQTQFVGEQLSARGGIVATELVGDGVVIRGRAITVAEGILSADPGPL